MNQLSRYKISTAAAKKGKGTQGGINNFQKFFIYWKKEGLRSTFQRIQVKVFHKKDMFTYDRWYRERQITEEELNAQREYRFSYNPKFSIVVPLYRTKESYLRAMIDSVAGQTYTNWELCLTDGSGEGHTEVFA